MAKTLLNGVNDVLKRLGDIKGNSGNLASLDNTEIQVKIDLAVQAWNEVVLELFSLSDEPVPNELGEQTITFATGVREYALNSDVVSLRFPFINSTTGHRVYEYDGGFLEMLDEQYISANYTGLPSQVAVKPNGNLYFDRVPTSTENGKTVVVYYDKSNIVTSADDVFPFIDAIYHHLIPCVAELVKQGRDSQSLASYEVSQKKFNHNMCLAADKLRKLPRLKTWTPYIGNDENYLGGGENPLSDSDSGGSGGIYGDTYGDTYG